MTDANGTLIRLEDMTKVFHADEVETHALSQVNLEIKRGEYISISGPSGCGKSTLLSILGLLDSPTGGSYWLDGKPVATLSANERTRIRNCEIGFIFQAFNLIGDLSVQENVELPLTYRGMTSTERKKRVQKPWSASAWRTECATIRRSSPAASSSAWPSPARLAGESVHPAG